MTARSRSDAPNNQAEGTDLIALAEARRGVCDMLRRCDDLFGRMLLTGKLKSIDRAIASHKEKSRG